MRYVLYIRKSTERDDYQVLSMESQETTLRELAERRGLNITKVLRESFSAKNPGRPVFNEMLGMFDAGKADGIICWKLDRLARNQLDSGAVAHRLQRGIIKKIVTADRDYNPDDNVLLMAVEAGMATQYVVDLSKNVRRGMKTKIEQGWLPNRPPCGWTYDKNTRKIVRDEYNFPKVQTLLSLALTGKHTPVELEEIANEKLHIRQRRKGQLVEHQMGRNYIFDTLRSPFHAGLLEYEGKLLPGAHEPMITVEEHRRLLQLYGVPGQRSKDSPMSGKDRKAKYPYKLSKVVRCPCGRQVSPWRILNRPGGKRYVYYSCSTRFNGKALRCGQPMIDAAELEAVVRAELARVEIHPRLLAWLKENVGEAMAKEQAGDGDRLVSLQRRKEQLAESKKRLLDHLLNGTLERETYQSKDAELRMEIESLETEIASLQSNADRMKREMDTALEIADGLLKTFDGPDFPKTQQMLRSVFESLQLVDGKLETKLRRPFQQIQKTAEEFHRALKDVT